MDLALHNPTAEPAAVKPVLKWAGGKTWFVKEFGNALFDHVLKSGGRYYEPFLGGASMALHLGLPQMTLGDLEPDLIGMYIGIRDDVEDVIKVLAEFEESGKTKESYYTVRSYEPDDWVESAAQLIYLNKLCFNGIYRKNKSGGFNVPYADGAHKRSMPTPEHLRAVSAALKGSYIWNCSFEDTICLAGTGDLIYADPPYDGTFTDYTKEGFGPKEQGDLALALYDAGEEGAEFFCHNADTPLIRELFEWATIIEMSERRNVNSNGEKRGAVPCVLITNAEL